MCLWVRGKQFSERTKHPNRKYKVRSSNLYHDMNQLMYELCVKNGYCVHLDSSDIIAEDGSANDHYFATTILKAEGWDAGRDGKSYDRALAYLRSKFVERYGKWVSTKYYKYEP